MARINKSAEVLAVIAKRSVVSQSDLTRNRELLNLFTGASSTPKRRIIDTAALLSKQGFVSSGGIDNEIIYKITPKGKTHLTNYKIIRKSQPKVGPWDHKWYIVTFEIPDSKKALRNNLIAQLKKTGFYNYTKGIWVYPYNPEQLVEALRQKLKLNDEIMLITAIKIDGSTYLKQHFNLN